MANSVKVKINSSGANRLLNSPEMQRLLKSYADRAKDSANASLGAGDSEGFQSYVKPGRNRARAVVHTTDFATRRHNAKTNAILKGL